MNILHAISNNIEIGLIIKLLIGDLTASQITPYLVPSTSEAKRLIQSHAVTMNETKIKDPNLKLDLKKGKILTLKVGKRRFAKIQIV